MDWSKLMDQYQKEHSGYPEAAIAEAEQRIGVRLPDCYREYLKQYGMDEINRSYNRLDPPEDIMTTYEAIQEELEYDWKEEFEEAVQDGNTEEYSDNEYFSLWQLPREEWHTVTENYVLLWVENQGVWHAGYLLRDLQEGNPNPPVYISTEDDFITFTQCTDNMEEFLKEMFRQASE